MPSLRRRGLLGLLALALLPAWANESAEALFQQGSRAQIQGRHLDAYLLYSRARALAPSNIKYVRAVRGVRRGAAQLLAAAGEHRQALEVAPESWEFRSLSREDREPGRTAVVAPPFEERRFRAPTVLRYRDHATSFRFRGPIRDAYEEAAAEFGVRLIFDKDFDGDQHIRANLTDCDFRCVTRALGNIGKSVALPLDSDLVLVTQDTTAKRSELEPTAFATIPLESGLTVEEVTEIAQAIQQVLDLRRFQMSSSGNVLFVRESVSKARLAQALVADLLHPRGAVQIELHMLTASSGRLVRAGIDVPTQFPVTNLSTLFGAVPVTTGGLERLIGLGGGETVLGVAVGGAALQAILNSSSARSWQTLQVLSAHGMQAEFKIGERYPIVTAQYSSGGAPSNGPAFGPGAYVQPAPSITFEDLGLNLTATPLVHSALEITLQLEVNFRFLAGGTVNDIPVLANREFRSQLRLRRGEFAIVSGMALYERRKSRGGMSGLGNIPWLGTLFRRNEWRWNRSDLLMLVRPRVARLPPAEMARTPTLLYGPEQRPLPPI